jgi:hypothetical protein
MPLYATEAELNAIRDLENRARVFLALTAGFVGVGAGQLVGIFLSGLYMWRIYAVLLAVLVASVSHWRRSVARRGARMIVDRIKTRSLRIDDSHDSFS